MPANEISRRSVLRKGALATGALLVGGTAATGTVAAGIGEGRVGHYHLNNIRPDGTVQDASSYSNDGENQGARVVRGGGRVGNALGFDGKTDLVEVPDHASLDLQEAITISFWFMLEGTSTDNQYPRPVSKGQSTTQDGAYSVFIEDAGGNPTRIGLRFIDTDGNKHDVDTGNSLPVYDDGNWHHVAATYSNAADEGRLYLDGVERASKPIGGDVKIRTTEDDLHLGDGNGQRHLNGKLDEVRLYNRAISEGEIQSLATMGGDSDGRGQGNGQRGPPT